MLKATINDLTDQQYSFLTCGLTYAGDYRSDYANIGFMLYGRDTGDKETIFFDLVPPRKQDNENLTDYLATLRYSIVTGYDVVIRDINFEGQQKKKPVQARSLSVMSAMLSDRTLLGLANTYAKIVIPYGSVVMDVNIADAVQKIEHIADISSLKSNIKYYKRSFLNNTQGIEFKPDGHSYILPELYAMIDRGEAPLRNMTLVVGNVIHPIYVYLLLLQSYIDAIYEETDNIMKGKAYLYQQELVYFSENSKLGGIAFRLADNETAKREIYKLSEQERASNLFIQQFKDKQLLVSPQSEPASLLQSMNICVTSMRQVESEEQFLANMPNDRLRLITRIY